MEAVDQLKLEKIPWRPGWLEWSALAGTAAAALALSK